MAEHVLFSISTYCFCFKSGTYYYLYFYFFGFQTKKAFLKQPKVFLWYENKNKSKCFLFCFVFLVWCLFGIFLLWVFIFIFLFRLWFCFRFENKIIYSSKKYGKGKRPGKGGNHYWKNIGLQLKTPREAIEGISLSLSLHVCVCVCEFEFWILTLSRVYTKYLVWYNVNIANELKLKWHFLPL